MRVGPLMLAVGVIAAACGGASPSTTPTSVEETTSAAVGTPAIVDESTSVEIRAAATGPAPSGYWTLERDGDVMAFGDAPDLGGVAARLFDREDAIAIAGHPTADGFWVLTDAGRVLPVGGAADLGDADITLLTKPGERFASLAANGAGTGVWVFTDAGRIVALGDATPSSQMANGDVVVGLELDGPIVGSSPTVTGQGVVMTGADGGVFAIGDAGFHGSVPGVVDGPLTHEVVDIVSDPDGTGYWLVGADGGVFAFEAALTGTLPAVVDFDDLVAPVNGIVPFGNGYLLVADDGGVFVFSDRPFEGSGSGIADSDVVGVAPYAPTGGASPSTPTPTTAPPTDPTGPPDRPDGVEALTVEVLARIPHDTTAFTQGLVLEGGRMYESTGLYGESTLREIDPTTGTVLRRVDVDDRFFAEGLELVDDRLVQLTWRERTALVYDATTFAQVGTFGYDTEGWGLCHLDDRLVMSDGTATLTFRDPATFAPLGTVEVTADGEPVVRLNELECVNGEVYANVWLTDTIVRIDPRDGRVTGRIDAAGLLTGAEARGADVLNGIAHIDGTDRFLITGKFWPTMFEVRFTPAG